MVTLPRLAQVIDKPRYLSLAGHDAPDIMRELHVMEALRHPHVVRVLDAYDTPKHAVMVMELCVQAGRDVVSRAQRC